MTPRIRQRLMTVLVLMFSVMLLVGSVEARQFVTIERINMTVAFEQAGGGQRPVLSSNGRWVAFWSNSNILMANDTNNAPDIFLRDRQENKLYRASVGTGGVQSNALSYAEIDIAKNQGNLVVFASDASNLVQGDTNTFSDIFLFDAIAQSGGATARISQGYQNNEQANGPSFRPVISGNGLMVAFRSNATNLVANDTNGQPDVFLFDRTPGLQYPTARINIADNGAQSNAEDAAGGIALNEDGTQIAFESRGSNLVNNDSNGVSDIFVRDRKANPQRTRRVSVSSNGNQANGKSYQPAISANGRYVVFASDATNLVSGDSNGVTDIFLHDRDTDENGVFDQNGKISTIRISVATDGTQANGHSYSPSISANGRYVTFWSAATNLVEGDTNGVGDIFVHDTQTGITSRVSVTRNGKQANGQSAFFHSISGDGRFVAFESLASNLVQNDTNNEGDIFLAQVTPNSPTNLVATPLSSTQIQLTWKDRANDETKYIVEQSSDNGKTWKVVTDKLAANTESYVHSGISACQAYSYRVLAANNVGSSLPSNVAAATPLDCPPGNFLLQSPANNEAVANALNLSTFTWLPAYEAVDYQFVLKRTTGAIETLADVTASAADICTESLCSFVVDPSVNEALTDGVYEWTVSASNTKGTTPASNNPFKFEIDSTIPPRSFVLQTPKDAALIRDPSALTTITWQMNPDAAQFKFILMKVSNNPMLRELGTVADLNLTPQADSDGLTCNIDTCTLTLDSSITSTFSTGTYLWTVLAISPGSIETEASNGAYRFSITTDELQLLQNTGFELDADSNKQPDGWSGKRLLKDKLKCNKNGKVFSNQGECAFMFKGGADKNSQLQQKIAGELYALSTGDKLVLTGFFSGKNIATDKGALQVVVKYEDKELKKTKTKITVPAGSYDYISNSGIATVAGTVKSVKVAVLYGGASGKLFFDDVTLVLEPPTSSGLLPDGEQLPLPAPVAPQEDDLHGLPEASFSVQSN